MGLLALGQCQFDLRAPPRIEIEGKRHKGQSLPRDCTLQLVDFLASQQQLAPAPRLMVHPAACAILGNMAIDQPDLLPLDQRIALRNGTFAGSKCLHLRALQLDSGLEPFLDEIVETGAPVLGDGFGLVEFFDGQ